MLNNEMWKIFKATGNINAYLYVNDCKKNEYSDKYISKNDDKLEENKKVLQGF